MALIIEDGSIVANANSYQTVEQFRSHLQLYGEDDTVYTDAQIEVFLIKAMDKLATYRDRYKGDRVSSSQLLDWPRRGATDIYFPGEIFPKDQIPRELEKAQLQFAKESISNDLQRNKLASEQKAIKKKVGPIEIAYEASEAKQDFTDYFAKAEAHITPLLRKSGLFLIRS